MNPAQMPYRHTPAPNRITYDFPTWAQYFDAAELTPAADQNASRENMRNFHESPSWSAIQPLARHGWTGADEKIRAISSGMVGALGSLVESVAWQQDVTGESVDVPSFLAGIPECFLTPSPKMQMGARVFRVLAPIGSNSNCEPRAYTMAGAVTVALAELIELAGHQSEIQYIGSSSHWNGKKLVVRATIKQAGQPLDAPLLAFQVAHADSFRRVFFAIMEGDPERTALDVDDGTYGRISYDYQTDGSEQADFHLPTVQTVQEYIHRGGTEEQLIAWLRGKLEAVGLIKKD